MHFHINLLTLPIAKLNITIYTRQSQCRSTSQKTSLTHSATCSPRKSSTRCEEEGLQATTLGRSRFWTLNDRPKYRNHHWLAAWFSLDSTFKKPRRLMKVLSIRSEVRQRKMEKESGMLDTPPTKNLEVGSINSCLLDPSGSHQLMACHEHGIMSWHHQHSSASTSNLPFRQGGSDLRWKGLQ